MPQERRVLDETQYHDIYFCDLLLRQLMQRYRVIGIAILPLGQQTSNGPLHQTLEHRAIQRLLS